MSNHPDSIPPQGRAPDVPTQKHARRSKRVPARSREGREAQPGSRQGSRGEQGTWRGTWRKQGTCQQSQKAPSAIRSQARGPRDILGQAESPAKSKTEWSHQNFNTTSKAILLGLYMTESFCHETGYLHRAGSDTNTEIAASQDN